MTSNVPAKQESSMAIEQYWSSEQAKIIQNVIAPGLTHDELMVFAHVCKQVNLDPIAKQIYAIKRGGRMCIQTGIDGFRLVAERTGKYAPGDDTQFIYDDKNRLMGAKVYVKKLTADGMWHQISATAFLQEYNPGQGLWRKMPHVMIEKCAEARALRRAFPADLSGLYTEEEMDQADARVAPAPKVEAVVSKEKAEEIDKYLNGHEDLRKEVLKLCKVTSVYEIKETQLEACRKFVKVRMEKMKNENKDEEECVSEAQ